MMNLTEPNNVLSLNHSPMPGSEHFGSKVNTLLLLAKHKIPVPETVFILSNGNKRETSTFSDQARRDFQDAISLLENQTGRKLGDRENPLLLAIRNAGKFASPSFKYSLLNFGLPLKEETTVSDFSAPDLAKVYYKEQLKNLAREKSEFDFTSSAPFAMDSREKIIHVLEKAIYNIWKSFKLRRKNRNKTTPVLILQAMRPSGLIPGNINGTIYSQDPYGASERPIGYFRKTHHDISKLGNTPINLLKNNHPEQYDELVDLSSKIQQMFGTICRISFGIEDNNVYILSVYKAPETIEVQSSLIHSYIKNNVLTSQEAVQTISSDALILNEASQLLNAEDLKFLGSGGSLGKNVSTGKLATDPTTFHKLIKRGDPVIFASQEMLPSDVPLLMQSEGLLTVRGGITSHVAVVMRGLNKACISGITNMAMMPDKEGVEIGEQIIKEEEWITLDESTKAVYLGKGEFKMSQDSTLLKEIADSTDAFRNAKVLVNADTVDQVKWGASAGAEGIGLVRSEHQMLTEKILLAFRCFLLSKNESQRKRYSEIIAASFKDQITQMLEILDGRPLHYRLLDAPVNEFIPDSSDKQILQKLEKVLDMPASQISEKFASLHETNNLLGCRGSRWGVINADFYKIQIETAIQAAGKILSSRKPVTMTLVVPMVNTAKELKFWSDIFREILHRSNNQAHLHINLGVMVETPKAALNTAKLSKYVDVICLGTNDLTQCVWGLSRDDASNFIPQFLKQGLTNIDPFQTLDRFGVGELVELAIKNARRINPKIQVYVCGEHASDPKSVEQFIKLGVSGISCNLNLVSTLKVVIAKSEMKYQKTHWEKLLPVKSSVAKQASRALKKIVGKVNLLDYSSAQRTALDWANEISRHICIPSSLVWKYFKRNLVEKYFGSWEYKRFQSGWATQDAVDYVLSQNDKIVRYSIFRTDIACHAVSKAFPKNPSLETLVEEFERLDHLVPVEIFPQQPANHLCFRALLHGNEFRFEAGIGQAMYTFEQERGLHPIVIGNLDLTTRQPKIIKQQTSKPKIKIIEDNLYFLLNLYGESLLMKCLDLSNSLGIDWLAIEGYFNYFEQSPPFVCDIDLPQDIAFHCS